VRQAAAQNGRQDRAVPSDLRNQIVERLGKLLLDGFSGLNTALALEVNVSHKHQKYLRHRNVFSINSLAELDAHLAPRNSHPRAVTWDQVGHASACHSSEVRTDRTSMSGRWRLKWRQLIDYQLGSIVMAGHACPL
jgi:hypothetical protein